MKISILLTFDYELPLGDLHGSYDDALFAPSNVLLKKANELKVPVTLFADILCYKKFKEWKRSDFCEPFDKQIHTYLENGHDVQLHLHPHWLTSSLKEDKIISSNDYTLADHANINSIVALGVNELTNICKTNQSDYKCIAYRGGGYCLAPKTAETLKALHNNGIRYDSSISKDYVFISDLSTVDFRNMPIEANWYLNEKFPLNKNAKEGILEVPIASIPKSIFEVPTFVKMKLHKDRIPPKRGSMIHNESNLTFKQKKDKALSSRMLSFDNYTYSPKYLMKILNHHVKTHKGDEPIILSAIGHPKSMGDYNFQLMEEFIILARKKYGDELEFTTFSELENKK